MTSRAKIEANRRNAQKSTGPCTSAGKAMARYNAVRHGVLTAAPLLPGEDVAAWDQHSVGVVASLAPVGALEQALAERVALTLWRLKRFARAEALAAAADLADAVLPRATVLSSDIALHQTDVTSTAIKAAKYKTARLKARLEQARTAAACLAALETAACGDLLPNAPAATQAAVRLTKRYKWNGPKLPGKAHVLAGLAEGEPWTAGHLRHALSVLDAGTCGTPGWLAAETLRRLRRRVVTLADDLEDARAHFAGLKERARTSLSRRATAALLPRVDRGDLLIRYESHLQKLLTTTLHEMERLQGLRAGRAVVPPVAVDVTVTGMAIDTAD